MNVCIFIAKYLCDCLSIADVQNMLLQCTVPIGDHVQHALGEWSTYLASADCAFLYLFLGALISCV